MKLSVRKIAEIVGGRLLSGDPETVIRHVTFDSRVTAGDDLFIPTVGERADGYRFIDKAFENGAAAVFTARHESAEGPKVYIRVEDPVKALQELGSFMRAQFKGPVAGITGSVGKTTTREMTKLALSAGGKVTGNEKNMNSQLGLPVTLCHMDERADLAVLEMGVSEPGDMEKLVNMARPTLVLVTNIGITHIETMGSRETICREKMRITDHLTPADAAVLNGEEPMLLAYKDTKAFRPLYYGLHEGLDVWAKDITLGSETTFTAVMEEKVCGVRKEFPVILNVPGEHNVMNALATMTAAAALGIDPEAAAEKLSSFGGFSKRLERVKIGELNIIDDSYNASPVSMKAALDILSRTDSGRRFAILADMHELGPEEAALHREVGEYAAALPIEFYITMGELIRYLEEPLIAAGKPVFHVENVAEAAALVKKMAAAGDTLLLKGSNTRYVGRVRDELVK